MSSPLSWLDRLSLEEMPSTSRSRTRDAARAASSSHQDGQGSSASDTDSGDNKDCTDSDDNEQPDIIRSPSRLLYNLDQLSDMGKAAVRDVFNEPPRIALQRCRRIGNTYAFQMTELVTRSIRIRAPETPGTSPNLSCSCGRGDEAPCDHLLWLLDQILKQTLYNHNDSRPLTMNKYGYAEEMGDPFQSICDFHLEILADGLHCSVVKPYSHSDDDEELNHHRIMEARELLASVYSTPPELFRPDIFTHPTMDDDYIIRRDDLETTVFRMLLDNHHFFHYFLSFSRPTDPISNIFRKLSQRVDHVIRELDSFSYSPSSSCSSPPTSNCAESCGTADQTTARDVTWAAKHLLGIVGLIRSSIYTRDQPLQPDEALDAARTLVQILALVVARNRDANSGQSRVDRNLYLRLIGDQREGFFVVEELDLLPEAASHLVDSLDAILEQIELQGAPTAYVARFRALVGRLRTSSAGAGAGSKRHVAGQERGRDYKRMK